MDSRSITWRGSWWQTWWPHACYRGKGRRQCLRWLGATLLTVFASLAASAEPQRWRLEGWRTDFGRTTIGWQEIRSGGPPKDGIPSIDRPQFWPVGQETSLAPNEPVIGLVIGSEARAYPLRILIWHEIVNDTVAGTPVAATYCPLCNSGVVFDRRVADRVLDFGTTGKLRNSDLVMYDRQTESWWQQFTGEAIVGNLVGTRLKVLPARLESFAEFKARFPSGKVLVAPAASARAYGRNPYDGYDTSARPFLFRGEFPEGIEPLARVVVVKREGRASVAVALDVVRKRGSMQIDGVTLTWTPGQASALDASEIAKGRDVGSVTATIPGVGGRPVDVPYDVTFAFVAHAFHRDVAIIRE